VTGGAILTAAQMRAAEQAADDLRRSGRIVGELLFTADASAGEISVAAELAPVAEG